MTRILAASEVAAMQECGKIRLDTFDLVVSHEALRAELDNLNKQINVAAYVAGKARALAGMETGSVLDVVGLLVVERDDARHERDRLAAELAAVLAERDAAVSVGTQLERERDRLAATVARVEALAEGMAAQLSTAPVADAIRAALKGDAR